MHPTEKEIIRDRDKAILLAREILKNPYFVFDTETTGKNRHYDQIVEWGIVTSSGKKSKSLAKVTIPVTEEAYAIHHISNDDLKNAPCISDIMGKIMYGKNMICYNVGFDACVLKNSLRANVGFEIDIDERCKPFDAMKITADFRGEWSEEHNDYRWRKLDFVCEEFGICTDSPFHDALTDAIMTEAVIKYIANQKLSTEENIL